MEIDNTSKLHNSEVEEINVSREYLRINTEYLFNRLFTQISYYKKFDYRIGSLKDQIKKYEISVGLIITLMVFILFIGVFWWIKVLLLLLPFFYVIKLFISIHKINTIVNKLTTSMNHKKMKLVFEKSIFVTYMKNQSNHSYDSLYNISSNHGYLIRDNHNQIILFPNFALVIDDKKMDMYYGDALISMTAHQSQVLSDILSRKHKFRTLSYQKWQYQRKDGGPDRRYSNNQLYNFYECNYLKVFDFSFDIPNVNTYNQLLKEWKLSLSSADNYNINSSQKKSMNFDTIANLSKEAIIRYLVDKKIIHNDYGDMIEIEYNRDTYMIDNKGFIKDSKLNIIDLLEGLLND